MREIQKGYPEALPHGCFAHLFQRAIRMAVQETNEVRDIVSECEKMVEFIDSSPKLLAVLEKMVTDGVFGHKPIPAGATRWDGIQVMLQSVLDQVPTINRALLHCLHNHFKIEL